MLEIRPARPEDESFLLALNQRLAAFPVPGETAPGHRVGYVFATTREDYFLKTPQAHVEILAVEEFAEGRGVARGLYEHLGFQPETVHYIKRF